MTLLSDRVHPTSSSGPHALWSKPSGTRDGARRPPRRREFRRQPDAGGRDALRRPGARGLSSREHGRAGPATGSARPGPWPRIEETVTEVRLSPWEQTAVRRLRQPPPIRRSTSFASKVWQQPEGLRTLASGRSLVRMTRNVLVDRSRGIVWRVLLAGQAARGSRETPSSRGTMSGIRRKESKPFGCCHTLSKLVDLPDRRGLPPAAAPQSGSRERPYLVQFPRCGAGPAWRDPVAVQPFRVLEEALFAPGGGRGRSPHRRPG